MGWDSTCATAYGSPFPSKWGKFLWATVCSLHSPGKDKGGDHLSLLPVQHPTSLGQTSLPSPFPPHISRGKTWLNLIIGFQFHVIQATPTSPSIRICKNQWRRWSLLSEACWLCNYKPSSHLVTRRKHAMGLDQRKESKTKRWQETDCRKRHLSYYTSRALGS